jgi:hypothetical protein
MTTRDTVLSWLRPSVRDLLDEIEIFAGQEVNFQEAFGPAFATQLNPLAPASSVSSSGATIFVQKPDTPDENGILHELLHIHRFWVERVPQVVPKSNNKNNLEITSSIENALEHEIIIPQESSFGFDSEPHWREEARTYWGRYPWQDATNPFVRKNRCFLGWLYCHRRCGDKNIVDLAARCLAAESLLNEAQGFGAEVFARLHDKERLLAYVVHALGIPRDEVRLLICDIRKKQSLAKDMPPP